MTPTWSLILLVFVFWTYPAIAAVIAYRIHGSSMENVKTAFKTTINDISKALSLDSVSLGSLDLEPLNLQLRPEEA